MRTHVRAPGLRATTRGTGRTIDVTPRRQKRSGGATEKTLTIFDPATRSSKEAEVANKKGREKGKKRGKGVWYGACEAALCSRDGSN